MPFDQSKADRVIEFISYLTHTKGEWAGRPFGLLPWQVDLISRAFGTLREDGTRQYRIVYVEIPKKNGKTELSAAIALYMLTSDGEGKPEVFSAAADIDQARLIFDVAVSMIINNEVLEKKLKIIPSSKRIVRRDGQGYYRALSSEIRGKHGYSPSCICFDELHAQPNDELWRVLTAGTDYARSQQLIIVLTTAGIYDKESIWWRVREKARQIESGIIEDPGFLPILYIADPEEDDPHDERLWERVNPSLGHIFTLDKIRRDYEQARNDLVEWEDFKRFRLNIPAKHIKRWLPMEAWDRCNGMYGDAELVDRPCYGGLDLSSTVDLAAFALVFPPTQDDKWIVKVKAYCPEDTIRERTHQDRVHYDRWVQQGLITATPGNVIDYAFIEKDILEASEKYDLREVGYDPWNATQLATKLFNEHGIQMVEVRQGTKTLSEPAKDILKTVLAGDLKHAGNPVLRWCADNVVMTYDANENIRPQKDKSTERIDLFVAMLIAWARAIVNIGVGPNVYAERGVLTIG